CYEQMRTADAKAEDCTVKELLDVEEARALLTAALASRERATERISIALARGRIAAESVVAPVDVPAHAASAMDGYAACSRDPIWSARPPHRARLVGESRAGHPPTSALEINTVMRIFTGAVLPARSDAVIIQENTRAAVDHVEIHATPEAGDWVREPGNDVKRGTVLVERGR